MQTFISEDKRIKMIKGDCLKVMEDLIEQGEKVKAIIVDMPFWSY